MYYVRFMYLCIIIIIIIIITIIIIIMIIIIIIIFTKIDISQTHDQHFSYIKFFIFMKYFSLFIMKVSEKSMTTLYNIKYKKYIHLQLQCKNTKIDVSQTHDSHFSES